LNPSGREGRGLDNAPELMAILVLEVCVSLLLMLLRPTLGRAPPKAKELAISLI
jgi:hypothetical protein